MNNQIDINNYRILKGGNVQSQNLPSFEPVPNENDYLIGFIYRYFARKRNDENGIIKEIKKEIYDSIINDSYHIICRIKWKISGNESEVVEANTKSINYGKQTITNLDLYCKNLKKFYRK